MSFDRYLQSQGYKSGSQLSPQQAQYFYSAYQKGGQQSDGGNGMGSMMGLGQSLMGSQGGGGGQSAGGMGGSWGGAVSGALAGMQQGSINYANDPNMSNQKDGFGTNYRDYRAEVGGAALGGVMGYYGAGALAGPAVEAAHPVMEPATRWAINTGDSFGGAGGAMMMDPFGTVASGKYSGEELAWGATLGPAAKWFGII